VAALTLVHEGLAVGVQGDGAPGRKEAIEMEAVVLIGVTTLVVLATMVGIGQTGGGGTRPARTLAQHWVGRLPRTGRRVAGLATNSVGT
jgi:hypothetical protein